MRIDILLLPRFRALACVALVAALSSGCAGASSEQPVPDSTMVDVLIELHLLNARVQVAGRPLVGARDSIYSRYGIDSTRFVRAVAYYAERPEAYSDIYGRVVDGLAAEQVPMSSSDSMLALPGSSGPSP